MNTENHLELTETHSSGILSQDTTVEILQEIQILVATRRTRLEEFEDRIIFMSMYCDIDWTTSVNRLGS